MTALDFITRGVRFEVTAGRISVVGPRGATALAEQLRAEVERRLSLARGDLPRGLAADGWCSLCRDETDGEGVCALCALARQKIADTSLAPAPVPEPTKKPPVAPPARFDRWLAVERECPAGLARETHVGRLHLLEVRIGEDAREVGRAVRCVGWRPLVEGERASDAWIDAADGVEVPGARPALYPPPLVVPLRSDEGALYDRLWIENAVRRALETAGERQRGLLGPAPREAVAHYESLRTAGLIDVYPERAAAPVLFLDLPVEEI